jgi:acetyl-CoA carboxylase biotin carboxylase subunit
MPGTFDYNIVDEWVTVSDRDSFLTARRITREEGIPAPVREAIRAAAVQGARAAGYINAGTWEFLVDRNDQFYFMEANTRLQVEHPVTEAISGIDLVKAQLMIADGQPLALTQDDVRLQGHAIECRITADDVQRNFMPVAGRIHIYLPPGGPGVRVDSHVYSGYEVPPYYDSLLAKIITWGADRAEATERMKRALSECMIEGIATTIPLHQRLLAAPAFVSHQVSTTFIEDWLAEQRQAVPA